MKSKTKFLKTLSKHSPSILTTVGIGGMWVAAFMLAKVSPLIKEKIEEKSEILDSESEEVSGGISYEYKKPTKIEKIKISMPIVWPALAIGGFSSYCIVSANRVNLRRNAALASAYYISQNALHEYQTKVIEHIGERKAQKVKDDIAKDHLEKDPIKDEKIIITGKGSHLCYILPFGIYFESDIEKVKQAVLTINERLINGNEMYVSVNDFLTELQINPIGVGDDLGWNIENGQFSVNFSSALATDGRPCLTIDFDVVPI